MKQRLIKSPIIYFNGFEIDLILKKGNRILAFEYKVSPSPSNTEGFWIALEDVHPERCIIIAPVQNPFFLLHNV